jgi:hypothetical protein
LNQRTGLHLALALCCLALSFFAFSSCLDNEFTTTDSAILLQAQAAQTQPEQLQDSWWYSWHRPLAQHFLAWEYRIAGVQSSLYFLVQILLHAVNATLVFALFRYPTGTSVAAAAAMLFAVGFGFYGTSVFAIHSVDQILALTFVLSAGIAAARAQLLRTGRQRVGSMLIAALLFLCAAACNELALMGLIVIAAFMWPQRRSLFSLLRKLALLVLAAVAWVLYQWQHPAPAPEGSSMLGAWLWVPWHTLQLATWTVVPLDTSLVTDATASWTTRLVGLLEQTRPAYSLVLGSFLGWWMVRGSGALRWLTASWLAFLVPVALWAPDHHAIAARDVYLASPFFAGLLAHGLRKLWLQTQGFGHVLVAALVAVSLTAELLLVRVVETRHASRGRTATARAAQELLLRDAQHHPPAPLPSTKAEGHPVRPGDQKSVPMATLVAGVVPRLSGSNNQAQSTLRTNDPRLMRPPTP